MIAPDAKVRIKPTVKKTSRYDIITEFAGREATVLHPAEFTDGADWCIQIDSPAGHTITVSESEIQELTA